MKRSRYSEFEATHTLRLSAEFEIRAGKDDKEDMPEAYVDEITVKIDAVPSHADADSEAAGERVGTQILHVVHFDQNMSDGFHSRVDVLDAHSAELSEYIHLLADFDDQEWWRPELRIEQDAWNLVVFQTLYIEEKWRGFDLGLLVVSRLLDTFQAGCGVAATKPFPTQFSDYLEDKWVPPPGMVGTKHEAFKVARRKLQRHWERIGFSSIAKTDLMIIDLACQRPSFKQAIGEVPLTRKPRRRVG